MMASDPEGPASCDLIVIGGGMAGLPIANKATYKGLRTVLVEKETLGGTCLNRGCIPTKTMIHSARIAHLVRRAGDFGVRTSKPDVDLGAVVDRKNEVVEGIRKGSYRQVRGNDNLELIEGEARFEPDGAVRVADRVIRPPKVIVNVGARPAIPAIAGLDRTPYLTSREALDIRELPESLIVIGGGFVWIELAQMFARFGARVTVLQRSDRILPREEPEIGDALREVLEEEGLVVRTDADVQDVEPLDDGVRVRFHTPDDMEEVNGDRLLVATGRAPNTESLGLGPLGVDVDEQGFIQVDSRFRTTAEGIYAIGDVTGRPMFTHTARDDADLLYRILIKGDADASTDGRVVPHATFTDPEVASVGLTEAEARQQGYEVAVGRQDFSGVARARAMGETRGFIKLVAEAGSKHLLGAHILGPSAGELIHELALGLVMGVSVDDVARTVHVHPTLTEGVNAAAGGVHRPAG